MELGDDILNLELYTTNMFLATNSYVNSLCITEVLKC